MAAVYRCYAFVLPSYSILFLFHGEVNDDEQRLASLFSTHFFLYFIMSIFTNSVYVAIAKQNWRFSQKKKKKKNNKFSKNTAMLYIKHIYSSSWMCIWFGFFSLLFFLSLALQRNWSKTPWFNVLPNWPNCLNNLHIFFPWVFESSTVTKRRMATQGSHDVEEREKKIVSLANVC